jgi:type IV secretion system protein VirB10
MKGADMRGYSGFHDKVDKHYWQIYKNAILLSMISAGVQLSQPSRSTFESESVGNTMGGALGQNLGNVSTEFVRKGMDVAPTIEIRQGYRFQVVVSKDIVFPGVYEG